ncbi:flap endonuclease-1, partial [Candidatus Woesearchaeota archaeon]|nr:flap endonuclease-1 [Candidatus Woesearchaeota archaeon]
AFNVLYQFLSSIRGSDGALLQDSNGRVTSHLYGLFSRTMNLITAGVKPVYVFDGKAPDLKYLEQKRRSDLKKEALNKYEIAKQSGDLDEMKKYASRTSRLTQEMIEDAKLLIDSMGVPIVQAPSEGEAQATFMCKQKDVYAVASQDGDSLLFGAPILIKNLTLNNKRKVSGTQSYVDIKIEQIELKTVLSELEISQDQLIVLGILIGTDFNQGGIKGIGPKKALNLIKKHNENFEALFEEVNWNNFYDFSYKEVINIFKNIKVNSEYSLKFNKPNKQKIIEILVDKHNFSMDRINSTFEKYEKKQGELSQQNLGAWT